MRWANDGLRFLLEIALLTSLAYWGFSEQTGALQWVLGLGVPLGLPLEVGVFAAGVVALLAVDRAVLAWCSPPWSWFTSA